MASPQVATGKRKLGPDVRRDFPVLHQAIHGQPLAYLDSAASSQKPNKVIDAISEYYRRDHANVHRGVHSLSQRATDRFDEARLKVQRFLGAASPKEIIFTKGCTEAINLVAHSWGRANLCTGDRVLLTHMEHHANIVPWQLICEQTGAEIIVAPITDAGELDWDGTLALLDERVKLVGCVHVSNALGTINPVAELCRAAHAVGARVMVDGAQACGHLPVDVRQIDADFYTLSGHKVCGPTGIGCLYGKQELLEAMPPYQGGGDMIRTVSFEKTTFNDLPNKFEPGTPAIAEVIGLGVALDYLTEFAWLDIRQHEQDLTFYAQARLTEVPGLTLVGTAKEKSGIVSFVMDRAHPHDIGTILDSDGIAIRTGHHCCMPLMKRLGQAATARASFGLYTVREEIDALVNSLHRVNEVFA